MNYQMFAHAGRLHELDGFYSTFEPFLSAIAFRTVAFNRTLKPYTRTRAAQWLEELSDRIIENIDWPEIIKRWTDYCIDTRLHLPDAVKLFCQVLWARRDPNVPENERDGIALKLLSDAQVQSTKTEIFIYRYVPRKYNPLDPESSSDNEEDGEQAWNSLSAESSDTDSSDDSSDPSELFDVEMAPYNGFGSSMVDDEAPFNFPLAGLPVNAEDQVILTTRSKGRWNRELLENPDLLRETMSNWVNRCHIIFGLRDLTADEYPPDPGSILQEMNYLSPRIYKSEIFQGLIRTVGLDHLFELVGGPANNLEIDPHLVDSFRVYRWRAQFNTFHLRWTPVEVYAHIDWENAS
ncbi:hypothetical protein B0H10DRAFT_1984616 [Mycena sp. CBHHK59/15]|nr:hypothetical protein B0H10DRAFT_1984616 [Mycena sp. CBHHK59/15]